MIEGLCRIVENRSHGGADDLPDVLVMVVGFFNKEQSTNNLCKTRVNMMYNMNIFDARNYRYVCCHHGYSGREV